MTNTEKAILSLHGDIAAIGELLSSILENQMGFTTNGVLTHSKECSKEQNAHMWILTHYQSLYAVVNAAQLLAHYAQERAERLVESREVACDEKGSNAA